MSGQDSGDEFDPYSGKPVSSHQAEPAPASSEPHSAEVPETKEVGLAQSGQTSEDVATKVTRQVSSNSFDDDNFDPYSGERITETTTTTALSVTEKPEPQGVNAVTESETKVASVSSDGSTKRQTNISINKRPLGETTSNDTSSSAPEPNYEDYNYDAPERRPRKRKLAGDVQKSSAFSLRNRVRDDETDPKANKTKETLNDTVKRRILDNDVSEDANDQTSQSLENTPAAAHKPNVPAWMRPEDVKSGKQFKRPKRRGNINDQIRRAEEYRKREEETEERNLGLERQRFNAQQGQLNEIVRSHYNQRTVYARREKREQSTIFKLRNFNNVVKYMLIGKYTKRGDCVLDMGCGKGGDLLKYQTAQVSHYVGLDISPSSIEEAVKRYRSIRNRNFEVFFATADAFGGSIDEALSIFPPGTIQFPVDVVSSQFAFHYAFESEAKVRNTLAQISNHLKVGGYFIGTIPSSDYIKYRLKGLKPGEKKWGNSLYSVEFVNTPPQNGVFSPAFGNAYIYYLKDAVDHVPEYVVPFEALRSLAEEYDLELRYKKPLFELYVEEIPHWYNKLSPKLINGLKRSDGKLGLEGEDKQAAEFYLAFAFEKTGYQ